MKKQIEKGQTVKERIEWSSEEVHDAIKYFEVSATRLRIVLSSYTRYISYKNADEEGFLPKHLKKELEKLFSLIGDAAVIADHIRYTEL